MPAVLFFAGVLLAAPSASAAPGGTLDATFGSGGTTVLTDPGGALGLADAVNLPDGSIIVGTNRGRTSPTAISLIEIDPDGAIVDGFARDGFAAASWVSYPYLRAMTVDPEGRIVVVGQAALDGNEAWLIARFDPDGALDHSFGTDGAVVQPMPGFSAAYSVAVAPDGGIVVGGSRYADDSFQMRWALARFDAGGSLDPSFGVGGVAVLPYADYFGVRDLALLVDGRIVATGFDGPDQDSHGLVARFLADGSIDQTFGDLGATVLSGIGPGSLVVDPQGRIVMAGFVEGAATGFGIARLLPNGTPDVGFGTDGVSPPVDPGSWGRASAVAIQTDGRIVAAGTIDDNLEPSYAVARFTGNGQIDATFGSGGRAHVTPEPWHPTGAGAVAIQPDGRIVVTGTTSDGDGRSAVTVRRFFASDGPAAVVDSGPLGPVGSPDATFEFSSPDAAATFTCSLDGSDYAPCASPATYPNLVDGIHSFAVRATDAAENIGVAAVREFEVDTVSPGVMITSGPSGTVYWSRVSFAFSSDEANVSFSCALDAGPYVPCASPTVLNDLTDASHAFQVRATDPAGNVGPAQARVFTVDTADAFQPDASIALGDGQAVGSGVVNLTGRHQQAAARITRGRSATFRIRIENTGAIADSFRVRARDSLPGCVVRYFQQGHNVTSAVGDGSFATREVEPGGRTSLVLRVVVRSKARLGLRPDIELVTGSLTRRAARDVVVAKVVVVR
jgi:uncharacterized delta-60 repeat protein